MKKILFIYLLFTFWCYSQAGSFDTTFDTDGKATYCFVLGTTGNTIDGGFQSSGKIVQLYYDYNNPIKLLRWNTNGTLDNTFGNNGILNYTSTGTFINGGHGPYKMIIQSDDKIVIMGTQQNNTFPNAYWVARLLPDGALDTTFNGTGYKDLTFGTIQDRGTCVALQADGKILLGGTSGNTAEFFTVARLNSNGTLDTGFGNGGKAQIPFNGAESFVQSMAVQPDGKIVLGGYTVFAAKDFALARVNSNGTLDTTFGTNGKVITTLNTSYSDLITDLFIEPNGNIIAGGCTSSENYPWMCMVRYNANGSIDTAFGTNGVVINNDDNSRNCTIARQLDGKIIMGGCFDGAYFMVARYTTNGSKDTGFGTNGAVNVFPTTYGFASKVLIQPDNKIVVCGNTGSSTNQACAAVVRLNPDTLGVDEFEMGNEIVVYPNPSTGIFNLKFNTEKFNTTEIVIFNTIGQVVYENNILISNEFAIDISNLPAGHYFMKVKNGEELYNHKIIKN